MADNAATIGAIAVAAVGGIAAYEINAKWQAYKTAGGTLGFWAWIKAGMSAGPGGGPGGSGPNPINPQITVSPMNISYTTNSLTGPTYSTSTITISCVGTFTPSTNATLYGVSGLNLGTIAINADGTFSPVHINLPGGIGGISAAAAIASYGSLTVTDSTGKNSPTLFITWTNNTPPPAHPTLTSSPDTVAYASLGSVVVTLTGTGFPAFANDIVLSAYINGVTSATASLIYNHSIEANLDGTFTASVELPLIIGTTEFEITATGQQSGVTESTTIQVTDTPPPPFTLLPPSPSSLISVGTGLPSYFTAVGCTPGGTIEFVPIVNTGKADEYNLAPFKISANSSGVAVLTVTGASLYVKFGAYGTFGMYAYDDSAYVITTTVTFALTD